MRQQRTGLHFWVWRNSMRILELPWKRILRRAYQILLDEGFAALVGKAKIASRSFVFSETYGRWIARYDTLDRPTRQSIEADIAAIAVAANDLHHRPGIGR